MENAYRRRTVGIIVGISIMGIGLATARAQVLSGSSIFFTDPLLGTGATASSVLSSSSISSIDVRFFNISSAPQTSTGTRTVPLGGQTVQFPAGTNLRIEGIPSSGQAIDIPIQSYNWIETREQRNRVTVQDFHFVMRTNVASPYLFQAVTSGTRFPRAILTVRRNGSPQEIVRWTLGDIGVTAFQTASVPDDLIPVNAININFSRIMYELTPTLPDGTTGNVIRRGWDIRTNRPL